MTVQYDGQESPTAEDRIEKSSTEHQEKMVSAEAQNSADENDGEISDHDRDHDRNHEQPSSPPHQEHHRSPRDGGHYSSHPSDERPPSPGLPLDHQEDPHRSRESDAQKPDSSAGAEQTTEPGRNHVQSAPARDPEGRNHPDDHAPRENHPDDHPPGGNHPENHPPGRNHPDDHPPGIVNLFVRNVAKHVMEDQLVELFSKYGKVHSAVVVRDPHSRECRGFGFVKMWSDADAEKAIQNLGDFEFEGRHISVERAKRTGPHTRTPGAYMGIDRRIRDRYAGMKRTRDYAPGEYPVAGGEQYPPMRRGGYRGRYEEYPRPRYDDRSGGWAPRPEYRQPYNERAFYEERPHSRRRYDEGPRYPPRDLDRVDDRYRDREPPVPRESGGSGDVI